MMVLITDKVLFMHIPKTGGVWLSYAMRRAGMQPIMLGHQHNHFPQLLQLHDEEWYKKYFIFTMIRHPLTWYQSRWAFRVKHGWRLGHPLDLNCASNDFHVFMDNILRYKPDGWVTWLYEQYINNVPGGIDYVARLEYCVEDAIDIFTKANIDFDPSTIYNTPRANDSDMGGFSSKHWAVYTPELMERVLAVESKIIDRYYSDYQIDPNILCGPRPW